MSAGTGRTAAEPALVAAESGHVAAETEFVADRADEVKRIPSPCVYPYEISTARCSWLHCSWHCHV